MKEITDKQGLVDMVIEALKKDAEYNNYTVLNEILENVPTGVLLNSLPDEEIPVKVVVSDIEYDTDALVGLPEEIELFLDPKLSWVEAQELVSDEISNITGFCHKGFACTPELEEIFKDE